MPVCKKTAQNEENCTGPHICVRVNCLAVLTLYKRKRNWAKSNVIDWNLITAITEQENMRVGSDKWHTTYEFHFLLIGFPPAQLHTIQKCVLVKTILGILESSQKKKEL